VLCAYRSSFVEAQLASMVRQSRPLDEIVIVDDSGGEDWGSFIRAGLAGFEGRIEHITNSKNLGMRRSYELAFSRSTADVIFMADHDDEWLPEKAMVVERTMMDPTVAGCFHDLHVYKSEAPLVADGEFLGRFYDLYPGRSTGNCSFEALLEWPLASGSAIAVRRTAIPSPMTIPESVFPDKYIQILAARTGRFVRVDSVLGNYRRHDANSTPLPRLLDRLRHRTDDPKLLADGLCGSSRENDEILRRFVSRSSLRRSVETGQLMRWLLEEVRTAGARSSWMTIKDAYGRPTRFVADEASHLYWRFNRSQK
jgi:glycosyltransferase involved in cell wall biosynthesis